MENTREWKIYNEFTVMQTKPRFVWDLANLTGVMQAAWAWDNANAGTVWSTGNSARRLRSTLTVKYLPSFQQSTDVFGWLTAWNSAGGKSGNPYMCNYHANKITEGQLKPNTPYHNFVKHTAVVTIEVTPAAPYLQKFTFNVVFYDYLNYFYQTISQTISSSPFCEKRPKNDDSIEVAGDWLVWHSSRLDEDKDTSGNPVWNPPFNYQEVGLFGNSTNRVGVTVLSGMPYRGARDAKGCAGNINKGRGMAPRLRAEPTTDYTPRSPIDVPMFLGPGTIKVTAIDQELIVVGQNNEWPESGYAPQDKTLPGMNGEGTVPISTNMNEVKETAIPVQSILENFKDAHTWNRITETWKAVQGLISERPYDTDQYYVGHVKPVSEAPYVINAITLNSAWVTHAKSFDTKYAIIFLMGRRAGEPIPADLFVDLYSRHKTDTNLTTRVIVDSEHVTQRRREDIFSGKGAFTIGSDYKYIIDPKANPTPTGFSATNISVLMPPVNEYYQFAALIYRITPLDGGGYEVDPEYPCPIEYWCGISTPNGDNKWRCMEPNEQITWTPKSAQESTSGQHTNQETVGIQTTAMNKNGSTDIGVTPTTSVNVQLRVPSTAGDKDLPPQGSYIRFFLVDRETGKETWNDTSTYLPTARGVTVSREILFLPGAPSDGREYQIYRQLYDQKHQPIGTPTAVGPVLAVKKEYVIESLTIEVTRDANLHPTFALSNLVMPNASKTTSYFYRFEYWYGDTRKGQKNLPTPSTWPKFSWDVDFNTPLPDSVECDLVLSVYSDVSRTNLLTTYYRLYLTEHYISSFAAEDVFAGERSLDAEKIKVQFKFTAATLLEPDDTRYGCQICLYPYTDDDISPDTEQPPLPEPTHVWDYESITNTFVRISNPIEIDPGTYRLSLQLIEKSSGEGREVFYTSYETPHAAAAGRIIAPDGEILIRTPFTRPSGERAEYRMLRDGVLGTVESPWEMRTESVIGGNTVTRPAWIVRPRTVSFRVLVTAPDDKQMSTALQDLIDVLTSAPTTGIELQLQTTDTKYQLSIFGYIQVGSPKIEIREDTVSIVSVTLDCPNYAWRGHKRLIQLADGVQEYVIRPDGHLPPSVDIWIRLLDPEKSNVTVNGHDPLKLKPTEEGSFFIHIHHNPIVQEYFIEEGDTRPTGPTANGVVKAAARRRHSPLSARSILLGDETQRASETQHMFELIDPDSYLPIILDPSKENTIKVVNGTVAAIEYVPHYAFWW